MVLSFKKNDFRKRKDILRLAWVSVHASARGNLWQFSAQFWFGLSMRWGVSAEWRPR